MKIQKPTITDFTSATHDHSNAANGGTIANITGNAATVTTNANLTGVVTSVGNATAIADAALSIAKTSGLQTAIDGKVADAINDGTTTIAPSQNAVFDALVLKIPISYLDTDVTLAANSDSKIATQKAIKAYADNLIAVANALVYKAVIDCSANPNYPAADAGWLYIVSVAGKAGGASGTSVDVGDMLICNTDSTVSGNQATVGAYWNIIEKNIVGAVSGPSSSTDAVPALFDGTTGKLIKNSTPTGTGNPVMQTAPTINTSITTDYLTASEMLISDASKKIVSAPVVTYPSLTELTYLKGVTSAIQTQVNGKAPSLGADDNYVTDAEKTKLSNLSGTNTGDQTLPVKATGAEINIGTDDAKFATAKAIADSNVSILKNIYKFSVYLNAAANTGNGAFAKIAFNSEDYDTSSNFDSVTNNRFIAPVAGYYHFSAKCGINATCTLGILSIYKNGTEVIRGNDLRASMTYMGLVVTGDLQLAATDYIEVFVYGNSTLALDVNTPTRPTFSGHLISLL